MNAAPVPRTAHSYAYETLRDQILSGVLVPGTPLIQSNLAAELSISMTPVREALRDLTSEGLVTQSPHKGAVVTMLDVADAIEINEIRLKLEPEAVAEAALVMSDTDFARCEELYDRLQNATAGEWVALNREFHMELFAATPSRRLRSVLQSLAGFAALYVGMAVAHRQGEAPQSEHRSILDAMKRKDIDAVIQGVRRHIQHSLDSLHNAAEDEAVTGRAR